VLLFAGSLNLSAIVRAQHNHWNVFTILFPMLPIFFVSAWRETNRPPFDLVEAESELVAGFFVEYSSTPFLLFFLGEISLHRADVRDVLDPVPGRLAAAAGYRPLHLDTRLGSGSWARWCSFSSCSRW